MTELIQIELRIQFTVNTGEKVQVKRRRDTEGIVIGLDQLRNWLFQIRAEKHGIAAFQNHTYVPKKVDIRRMAEVADGAAEEQDQNPLAVAPAGSYFKQPVKIFPFQTDNADRIDV